MLRATILHSRAGGLIQNDHSSPKITKELRITRVNWGSQKDSQGNESVVWHQDSLRKRKVSWDQKLLSENHLESSETTSGNHKAPKSTSHFPNHWVESSNTGVLSITFLCECFLKCLAIHCAWLFRTWMMSKIPHTSLSCSGRYEKTVEILTTLWWLFTNTNTTECLLGC